MKDNKFPKRSIVSVLGEGIEQAKTAKELYQMLDYKSERGITSAIHKLRISGEIICSVNEGDGDNGYFLPSDDRDIERFVKTMFSRMDKMSQATKPAYNYLKKKKSTLFADSIDDEQNPLKKFCYKDYSTNDIKNQDD